jgi:hypothetical protein
MDSMGSIYTSARVSSASSPPTGRSSSSGSAPAASRPRRSWGPGRRPALPEPAAVHGRGFATQMVWFIPAPLTAATPPA